MTAQMVLDGDPDKVDVSGYTKGDVLAADTTGTLTAVPVGADTNVFTADSADAEGVVWAAGGGAGTPSNTVVTETTFGQGSTAGVGTDYSRGDHTHGTPAAPSVPTASGSVVAETTFGQSTVVGVAATFSRGDHSHGTPAAPTAASVGLGNVDNTSDANKPVSTAQAAAITAITPYVRKAYITTGNVTPPNTGGAWAALTGFELAIPAAVGDYVEIQAEFLNEPKPSTFLDYAVIVGSSLVRFGATGTSTPGVEGFPGFYPELAAFKNMPGPVGFTVTAPDLDGGNVRFVLASASTSGAGTVFAGTAFPFFWRAINHRVVL